MQLAVCWPLAPMAHSLTHTKMKKKPAQLGINRDGQTSGRQRAMRCRYIHCFCCRPTVCAPIKTPLHLLP
jgi:hypothetical protein